MSPGATLYQCPVELLQCIIRFDTTNPPGNEVECIRFINDLLKGAGCSTQIISKDPLCPNLLTRVSGKGEAPPLLLYNHVDVVTTENQEWENDPFGGEIVDGFGRGGEKVNVIPSEIKVDLDGRLLPGYKPEDLIEELIGIVGEDITIEVLRFDHGPREPDMGLFCTLGDVLMEADPNGIPVPMMLVAVTDARFFSRLGIQTYGFTPMQIPPGMDFAKIAHGANERIPVEAASFGADAIYQVLQRFHE